MRKEGLNLLHLKRKVGLSSVITTLIIVLLAIVAIGVVWVVIQGVLHSTTTQIGLQQYTLNLKIENAKLSPDNSSILVTVNREVGAGNFSAIDFIFSNGNETKTIRENGSISELGSKGYTFPLSEVNLSGLNEVSIAPVLTSSGHTAVGNVLYTLSLPTIISTGLTVLPDNFQKLGFSDAGEVGYDTPYGSSPVEIKNVTINPLDVKKGEEQNLTAYVYSPYGVKNVTAFTQLDTSNVTFSLNRIANSSKGETWFTSWVDTDTHGTIYRTTFTAYDFAENKASVTLTWTDSCSPVQGVAWSVSANCTPGSGTPSNYLVSGLDSGNISIQSGAWITLGDYSVFARTPGYSINFLSTNGGIIYPSTHTGSITSAYLYEYDPSGAGYGNGTFSYGSSLIAPSGEIRAKNSLGTDCSPGNKDIYRYENTATDNDHDGYTTATASSHCVGNSTTISGRTYYMDSSGNYSYIASSSMLGTGDCYDYNANVHPGQTAWFTTGYIGLSGTSYDYNCDGSATEEYTTTSGSCTSCHIGISSCTQTLGTVGWSGTTVPSCGSSGTYVSAVGSCPTSTSGGCPVNYCTSGTTTQACH